MPAPRILFNQMVKYRNEIYGLLSQSHVILKFYVVGYGSSEILLLLIRSVQNEDLQHAKK
jgi:hypothetical protein